jgi:molecular chaperone DnaJ
MPRDYYDILGVKRGASDAEIKSAFRTLAHQHHPDKPGGDSEKFKEINSAYQTLSDPQKRAQYEQFGANYEQMRGAGGFGGGFQGFGQQGFGQGAQFDMNDLGEMFGEMFGMGGRGGAAREQRGRHIEVDVRATFNEAVFGADKTIRLRKTMTCAECGGNGAEKGSSLITCTRCDGQGRVKSVQQTVLGAFQTIVDCTRCAGKGKTPERACGACAGEGVTTGEREISVKIPAGVDDGAVLRISGEGEAVAHGGRSGDLYVNIRVTADPRFTRHGFDIVSRVELPIVRAALGGTIAVETVDGLVDLKIPAGTQPGQTFRLRGKGVPHLRKSGRGDHLVEATVKVPTKLSRGQKKALEQWEEL